MLKLQRNETCPCGSGKKYKKCCLNNNRQFTKIQRLLKYISTKEELTEYLTAKSLIYKIKIKLISKIGNDYLNDNIYKILELEDNITLYDLHCIIQDIFYWDNDHLFSFFMDNKLWSRKTEYSGNPIGEHVPGPLDNWSKPAKDIELRFLKLKKGHVFKYLFDYGDEILHELTLLDICDFNENKNYPYLVEENGFVPDQYDDD